MAMPMGIYTMRSVAAGILKKTGVVEEIVKKCRDNVAEAHRIKAAAGEEERVEGAAAAAGAV